jgi:hypothetical protein
MSDSMSRPSRNSLPNGSLSPVASARSSVSGHGRDRAPSPASTPGTRGVLNHQPMIAPMRESPNQASSLGSAGKRKARPGSSGMFANRRTSMRPLQISPATPSTTGAGTMDTNGASSSRHSHNPGPSSNTLHLPGQSRYSPLYRPSYILLIHRLC